MGHMVEQVLAKKGIECALCSEDITAVDPALARECECGTTMIYASNFSIGVNLLFKAADYLARLSAKAGGYTTSIEEIHHIHKLDAPSGTAITLGKIVDAAGDYNPPISSQRIGEVPGIHTLSFSSDCDKITLTHEAFSREGLAQGAVEAALMCESISGVHEFKDLI